MYQQNPLLKTKAYLNGAWCEGQSQQHYPVLNPANEDIIATIPDMGAVDLAQAVTAAEAAMPAWQALTAKQRSQILNKWHDLILAHQDDLAELMTWECGKPLAESRGEVAYGASFVEWFAEEGKRIYGDVIPAHAADKRLMTVKQPIGICAAITPWNFPLAMITRKCAPALAVGCAMIVKPAEATPLTALALAELGAQAGIPAGILNIVTAAHGAEVGAAMCADPRIRKLSFTGSTAVGKILLRQSADNVKKLSLELGGNAPFIVFEDADIEAAIAGAMASKYRNAGQTCVCANRFFIHDAIYDQFLEKFSQAVGQLKIGNGLDAGVTQGPLITAAAVEKIDGLLKDASAKGAKIHQTGSVDSEKGYFYAPKIVTDVTEEMDLFHQEIFGPVAPLYRFRDEAEVIAQANNTPYGLAAYFYSRDIGRCLRVAEKLEYGIVGINEGIISTEVAPFGGIKESGLGREGSKYGIDEYLELKYMCLGGVSA